MYENISPHGGEEGTSSSLETGTYGEPEACRALAVAFELNFDSPEKAVRMGQGMCKVAHGLYLGNVRDAKDQAQLVENDITHVVSLHRGAAPVNRRLTYHCVEVDDRPAQDIAQHFHDAILFIHDARLKGGSVLVHCMAGVSRSTTIVLAYLLTVTELRFEDLLTAVRHSRPCVCPNYGFRKQLTTFEREGLESMREKLALGDRKRVFALHSEDHSILAGNLMAAKASLQAKGSASDGNLPLAAVSATNFGDQGSADRAEEPSAPVATGALPQEGASRIAESPGTYFPVERSTSGAPFPTTSDVEPTDQPPKSPSMPLAESSAERS